MATHLRYITNHEEMRRLVTSMMRNVNVDGILFAKARKKINIASLRRSLFTKADDDGVITVRGKGFDKPTIVKPTSVDVDLNKLHAPEKISRIVEQNNQRLEHLKNISVIVDKHFDGNDSIVKRLKDLIKELNEKITKLVSDATTLLSTKYEQVLPPAFKVYTDKIRSWLSRAGLKYDTITSHYEVEPTPAGNTYMVMYALKNLNVRGTKLDYYVAISGITKDDRNFSYHIGVYNREFTLSQVRQFGYGERFSSFDHALNVLRGEFGLKEQRDKSRKGAQNVSYEPFTARGKEKVLKTPGSIDREYIKQFNKFRLDKTRAKFEFITTNDVDAKQAKEMFVATFAALKEWNTRYGLLFEIKGNEPKGRSRFTFSYVLSRKKQKPLREGAEAELMKLFGADITFKDSYKSEQQKFKALLV